METQACMKCGRDLKPGEVFCDKCQAEMEKYPVKPGVVVLLPNRSAHAPKSSGRRRPPMLSHEEQMSRMKKKVKHLRIFLLLMLATVLALGWLLFSSQRLPEDEGFAPGQNYSTVIDSVDPEQ